VTLSILPLVAAVLFAVAVPLLVFAVVPTRVARPRLAAPDRVEAAPVPMPSGPGAAPVAAGGPLRWVAPAGGVERLERSLALAGRQLEWPVERVLRIKLVLTAATLGLGLLFLAAGPSLVKVFLVLVVAGVAYATPDLVLASRARERQERIQHELADALDQITISLEAGLGLESAVARAGEYGKGPLAQELTRTVQDMRVGFTRREAYLALANRTGVVDLKRFARAIMQADQYGVSVGNVVRTQAKELRGKRRQRAEEKAMKVPVKILFPLMFSILPVLFIVILGPAAINLLRVLG
jgi:tight adherence protein C